MSLLPLLENLGFAGGLSVGAHYALESAAAYVLCLNNDARLDDRTLDVLVDVASTTGAGIVGARIVEAGTGRCLFQGRSWPAQLFGLGRRTYWPSRWSYCYSSDAEGSAMLIRRELVQTRYANDDYLFDPTLCMYGGDTELCLYARSRRWPCAIARDAITYHRRGLSSSGPHRARVWYYVTRNRLRIANRWLQWKWKSPFPPLVRTFKVTASGGEAYAWSAVGSMGSDKGFGGWVPRYRG